MANSETLCDALLAKDISGYNCDNPMVAGAENSGVLINRSDINLTGVTYDAEDSHHIKTLPLKSGKKGYRIVQSGKTPFSGTQQEMQEGTYVNTLTNTLQFVILSQGQSTAAVVEALMNGEFVAVIPNKYSEDGVSKYQVYGLEAGLHASAIVRELYNDDTLAGWLVTMTEETASKAGLFLEATVYSTLADDTDSAS